MLETKDPAIKLFGRKIQLPDDGEALMIHGYDFRTVSEKVEGQYGDFEKVGKGTEMEIEDDDNDMHNKTDDSSNEDERGQEASVNPKTPSIDEEETAKSMNEKSGNEESEISNSEKTLKKPDKLIPCPRCKSMETKFCYFNNYNVNQPRHFCKACQRYWTAGGTMRNVPVGAGRRKSKNSASYYRHITISEALEAARMEGPNRVLSFNLDAVPKCDPCVVNQAENGVLNGLKRVEEKGSLANGKGGESCDNGSRGSSSIAVQSSTDFECPQEESQLQKINCFPSHISCLPGVPWPYMWNPSIPQPQFCPPGFPLSFYPAAAWNCGLPGPWNTPWFSPQVSSPPTKSRCSESEPSSTLGKHSRDDDINSSKEEGFNPIRNGSVLIPKTLRIDDPSEAAKSSIWATLGIKNESISGGNLFKTFQSSTKGPEKFHAVETSPVLQANPAALSRSLVFHESS